MGVIATIPENTYPAGTRSFAFNPPAAAAEYRVTLTRVNWTIGTVLDVACTWNGVFGGAMRLVVGAPTLDRNGQPATSVTLGVPKPAGVTSASVDVLLSNAMTTAITIESLP